MSKTASKLRVAALSFFVASIGVYNIGRFIYPDRFFGTEDIWQWTMWGYASCGLMGMAAALALVAWRLRRWCGTPRRFMTKAELRLQNSRLCPILAAVKIHSSKAAPLKAELKS
jgi:hypothetical protein